MTFDLQLLVNSPSTCSVRRCCSEISVFVWRMGKASQIFDCFAESKVLWSTDLVLRSFFKSTECVCGHKNKNACGEVHRWRGRWVQTLACGNKTTQLSFIDPPLHHQGVAECKDRAGSLKNYTKTFTARQHLTLEL